MAVYIDVEICKGCEICVNNCPKNVLEMSSDVNVRGFNYSSVARPDDCIECKLCEKLCPDLAIFVDKQ